MGHLLFVINIFMQNRLIIFHHLTSMIMKGHKTYGAIYGENNTSPHFFNFFNSCFKQIKMLWKFPSSFASYEVSCLTWPLLVSEPPLCVDRVAQKDSIFKYQNIVQLQNSSISDSNVISTHFFPFFQNSLLQVLFFPKYSNFPALAKVTSTDFKVGRQRGGAQCFCFLFTKF